MTSTWDTELRFADHLADLADEISMRFFRNDDTSIRTKKDGTPVTEADEAIERLLREEIRASYPAHGVLGEEEGDVAGTSGSRWILDPIDGTKNFSWGIRNWGTLIALEVAGQIVCGVASAPALDERYAAARGSGATRNGEPIHVSQCTDLSQARIGYTEAAPRSGRPGFDDRFRRLLEVTGHDRGIGDFYGHMLVAAGSLEVMIEPILNAWDLGPLIVIVEEAGGRLTDLEGRAHIYGGSVLSTNGPLHDEVLELFSA